MKLLLNKIQQAANKFWSEREARERKFLLLAAAFIVATLYYLILIAPALSAREKLNKNLPQLHEQVAQMQALSTQVASLSGKAQTSVPTMSKETISSAFSAHGLSASGVSMVGESAQVQLSNVSFAQTLVTLDEVQKTLRVTVSEAKFSALDKPDQVDATLLLHQTAAP